MRALICFELGHRGSSRLKDVNLTVKKTVAGLAALISERFGIGRTDESLPMPPSQHQRTQIIRSRVSIGRPPMLYLRKMVVLERLRLQLQLF